MPLAAAALVPASSNDRTTRPHRRLYSQATTIFISIEFQSMDVTAFVVLHSSSASFNPLKPDPPMHSDKSDIDQVRCCKLSAAAFRPMVLLLHCPATSSLFRPPLLFFFKSSFCFQIWM
ncbi:hypothetical protein OROGR_003822 [Orobanche gracilis]